MKPAETSPVNKKPPEWFVDEYSNSKLVPDDAQAYYISCNETDPESYSVKKLDYSNVNLFAVQNYADLPGETTIDSRSIKTVTDEIQQGTENIVFFDIKSRLKLTEERKKFNANRFSEADFKLFRILSNYNVAKNNYEYFLKASRKYVQDPGNLYRVKNFINFHPMFWFFKERVASNQQHVSLGLTTNNGWEQVYVEVLSRKTKKGKKPVVVLEAGGAARGRTIFYHDYNLDVTASTLDEAYVKLAALIYRDYDEHGLLRDGRKEPNDNF